MAIAVLAAVQLGAIAFFDVVAGGLPLNDDWLYTWSARRLATGHGLALFPEQSALALPQIVSGAAAWLVHPSVVALRLETLAYGAGAVVLVALVSRQLGASPLWSAVAGATLAAFPVFAGVTTAFMSDPMYLFLLAASAYLGCRTVQGSSWGWLLVPVVLLATLQRQYAVAVPAALAVSLALAGAARRDRRRLAIMGGSGLAAAVALALPSLLHISTPEMALRTSTLRPQLALGLAMAAYAPALVGIVALPFLVALLRTLVSAPRDRAAGIPALAALGVVAVVLVTSFVFPGNYLAVTGLGPVTLAGAKPLLFATLLPLVGAIALAAFVTAIAGTYRARAYVLSSPGGAFVAVLAATQVVPMITTVIFDRYYLPFLMLLPPLLARVATQAGARAPDIAWAIAAHVGLGGIYVVGQQDYLAWQSARDQLALMVHAAAPGAIVSPGYEQYGARFVVPLYEGGRYSGLSATMVPSLEGPANPDVILAVAGPADPRPGINYRSMAPGRVVLVCPGHPCPPVESLTARR